MSSLNDPHEIGAARESRKMTFSMIVLASFGIAMIVIGTLWKTEPANRVIVAIGGVFFGTAISTLVSRIFSPAPLETMGRVMNELLAMPWRSNDAELKPLRRKYYGYLYTARDEGNVWLYRDFDFEAIDIPGFLYALVQYPGLKNKQTKYKYYGFVINRRLFLVGLNANTPHELAVIQIFPDLGTSGILAGMAFLEASTGQQITTTTLLSEYPLVEGAIPGKVSKEGEVILTKVWKQHFKSTQIKESVHEAVVHTPSSGEAI